MKKQLKPKFNKWVRDYLLSRSRLEIIMDHDSVHLIQKVAQVLAQTSPFLRVLDSKVFPAGLGSIPGIRLKPRKKAKKSD